LRSDASAWQVLELVPRHLVLTSEVVRAELGLSAKVAWSGLRELAAAGILTAHRPLPGTERGHPPTLYVATELLALAGSSPLR
jgi:hypothetical protein